MQTDHRRFTNETRPVNPDADTGEFHPRAVEMAETMRDLAATSAGVTFKALIGEGFTAAEITEHHPEAQRLANGLAIRQIGPSPDRLAEMIDKARHAWPNRMPVPEHTRENQAMVQDWGRYCAARAAYKIDRWTGQRERCLETLTDFLGRLPVLPSARKEIVNAVARTLHGKQSGTRH